MQRIGHDDGFDPRATALQVELHSSVQRAVVGDGQAIHAQCLGSLHQRADAAEAIQKAIFGMDVKVSERSC